MLNRLRLSPAMVVALIALFVSLGGLGYAATKIGTKQLRNGAVTAAKLHRNAVKASKIGSHAVATAKLANGAVTSTKLRDGAVTGAKLASGSVTASNVNSSIVTADTLGVPLAGVNVAANGLVRKSFNRLGGAITVTHPSTGVYMLTVPGLAGKFDVLTSLSVATLQSGFGEIRLTSNASNPEVITANSNGSRANRGFEWVALLHSP